MRIKETRCDICGEVLPQIKHMASYIRSRRHKVKVTTYKDEISPRGSELIMGYEKTVWDLCDDCMSDIVVTIRKMREEKQR